MALHGSPAKVVLLQRFFSVTVIDPFKSKETAQRFNQLLGKGFRITDWQDANKPLFGALSLERKVSFAIISLILFIAALNITSTLSILATERAADMAILRACGAGAGKLMSVFLLEGLILGVAGIAVGLILGLGGCYLGNYFRLVSLTE